MQIFKKSRKKIILIALCLILSCPVFAGGSLSEIDELRSELALIKDKSSPEYINKKQKFDKLIKKNKIDYQPATRLNYAEQLIKECKYNCAIYELNSLIDEGLELSKSYELLGDICIKTSKDASKIARYYKLSVQADSDNISVLFKLAKLYLKENKNILALENIKQIVEKTSNTELLNDIEIILKDKFSPEGRFENNIRLEILGELYLKLNRKEDAYYAYVKALKSNPGDIYIKYYLGTMFSDDGENRDAIILYDSILKEIPDDTQIRISKAKALEKEGRLLDATNEYYMVLNRYPNSNQAKYGIFKIYENKMPPDKIIQKVYNNPQYNVTQKEIRTFAKFLSSMDDKRAAGAFLIFADELDRLAQERELELERLRQQKLLEEKKLQEEKEAKIRKEQEEKELEIKKQQEEKERARIQKELQLKKKQEEKELALKKVQEEKQKEQLKKEEQKAKMQELQAQKEEELKLEKEKQEKLNKEKKQREYEKRAIEQEQKKAIAKNPEQYKKYKLELDKYLAVNPKDSQVYTAIANTYKLMGEPTNAIINYKEALKGDPANSDLYYSLGLTYLELNSPQTAKEHLQKALSLDKNNTKAINLLSFVNQKIITQTINNAYSKYENKNYIEALEILDNGVKNYPQSAQMFYYRALVYEAMNRNGAQIIDLQKAIELDPSYYMAYYQLGKAYEKVSDERSALVAYERFLSIEPDEKELIDEIQQKVISLGAKYY